MPLPALAASPSLEAQIADASDEIAYLNHDLDDGLRSGFVTAGQLEAVALWRETRRSVVGRMAGAPESVVHAQTVRALIDGLVTDWVEATAQRLERAGAASADAVRALRAARRALRPARAGPHRAQGFPVPEPLPSSAKCCA